jgi:protein TonB
MFDLTSGTLDRPFRDSHAAATVVSVAGHAILLGSIAWAVLFTISEDLPQVPTMMAFVAELPVTPPPPPPPPPAVKAAKASPPKPDPPTGPTFAAPAEIPVGIHPETGIDLGDEGGVVGGVEGGIPGGVLGGILGGVVTDVAPPPPPLPPPPRTPLRVGGEIVAPALIHRVEPIYPGVAVSAKVTGMVTLEATVNETGAVTDLRVLKSIAVLDQAAIKAVRQWRYQPLMLNGAAVPFILTVTITFSLR